MDHRIRLDLLTMYDAQLLRKWLYQELAYWNATDYFSPDRTARWHRMARRCARMLGTSRDALVAELGAEVRARHDDSPPSEGA